MDCIKCKVVIPAGRLKALPGTKVCVNCSDTQRWYLRNIISGKTTYSEAEIIKDPELAVKMRKMDRRAGWGSNLYKV
mgnify:FL=1|jgi:hypothetical protein|tara:strand:- start:603 stop:833 length:231 start_codon:yes stop_codon:yes gene_type:complete